MTTRSYTSIDGISLILLVEAVTVGAKEREQSDSLFAYVQRDLRTLGSGGGTTPSAAWLFTVKNLKAGPFSMLQ